MRDRESCENCCDSCSGVEVSRSVQLRCSWKMDRCANEICCENDVDRSGINSLLRLLQNYF